MKTIITIALALIVSASHGQTKPDTTKIIHHRVAGLRTIGPNASVHFAYADTLIQSNSGTIVIIKQKNGKFKHYRYPQGQSISIDYINTFIQQ